MNTVLLKGYKQYLTQFLKTEKGQIKYLRMVEHFVEWTEIEMLKEVTYSDMMEYIRYCQDEYRKPANINRYLRAICLFFEYLSEIENNYLNTIKDYNPAKGIQIKGIQHKIRPDYLDENTLHKLYEDYKGKHKVLLSLFVYQGLKIGEIEMLEKIHFDLKKGSVYIPKTINGNRRNLILASVQLYVLIEHITNLKGSFLFGIPLQNQSQQLCKELRKINPKVRNSTHLRGSRISYWVRTYDIREAQYLAGHNSIAATEKYKKVNLENLQNQIRKYHPLN